MESSHPSFSFPAFFFFFFVFIFIAIIIVLFLRRGVHINKKYLYSLLSFIQQKWKDSLAPEIFSKPATYYSRTSYVTFLHPLSNLFPKSSLESFSNPCHCQTLSFKSNSQNQMDYSSFLSLAQPQLPLPFPPPSPLWVLTATAEHHRSNEIGLCTLWKPWKSPVLFL